VASKKITITLTEEQVERAKEHARQAGLPVSTWVARVLEHEERRQDGLAAIAEWEKENGPITPEELAEARAEWARADAELLRARRRAG
jgi:cytosine/adenosine deaminase-related metal-dependent hydrolase